MMGALNSQKLVVALAELPSDLPPSEKALNDQDSYVEHCLRTRSRCVVEISVARKSSEVLRIEALKSCFWCLQVLIDSLYMDPSSCNYT
jgi:hypothetical protein